MVSDRLQLFPLVSSLRETPETRPWSSPTLFLVSRPGGDRETTVALTPIPLSAQPAHLPLAVVTHVAHALRRRFGAVLLFLQHRYTAVRLHPRLSCLTHALRAVRHSACSVALATRHCPDRFQPQKPPSCLPPKRLPPKLCPCPGAVSSMSAAGHRCKSV